MTATGSVGLMALFLVDLLSLLYVSALGQTTAKAGVGYATQVLFFPVAVNIGMAIAVTAQVARALGAGDTMRARRTAASGLVLSLTLAVCLTAAGLLCVGGALDLLGARGTTKDIARLFLLIALPGNVPLAAGMILAGLLRAVGDARRAMMVTLAGGIVTALLDPLLIFGLGLGVPGAAVSTLISRFVLVYVGLRAAGRHGLLARPRLGWVIGDAGALLGLAAPAVLTNLATPVGNGFVLRMLGTFGDTAVAAGAIIDRLSPFAFCAVFALTGSLGPIVGQNLGAGRTDRIVATLRAALGVTLVYVAAVWLILALAWPVIAWAFGAAPDTARYLAFYCRFGVSAWLFIGCLFVANTMFNNLGFPVLSTLFNWGRATLGTMPFVAYGAAQGGVEGIQLGVVFGAAVFGLAAVTTARWAAGRPRAGRLSGPLVAAGDGG